MRFEEFTEGSIFVTEEKEITAVEMEHFARDYDNQPLHLDPNFGAEGPFGRVIASGFLTLAVAWNLWVTTGALETHGRGGIGLDGCRWLEPVFPGDRIHARVTIGHLRVTSKGRGLVRMDFAVLNQHGRTVMEFQTSGLVARVGEPEAPAVGRNSPTRGEGRRGIASL